MKVLISILFCVIGALLTPSIFAPLVFFLAGVFAHSADRDRLEYKKYGR